MNSQKNSSKQINSDETIKEYNQQTTNVWTDKQQEKIIEVLFINPTTMNNLLVTKPISIGVTCTKISSISTIGSVDKK